MPPRPKPREPIQSACSWEMTPSFAAASSALRTRILHQGGDLFSGEAFSQRDLVERFASIVAGFERVHGQANGFGHSLFHVVMHRAGAIRYATLTIGRLPFLGSDNANAQGAERQNYQ